MTLSPAEVVVYEFGGVRATARLLGLKPAQVCKWKMPKEKTGTGGLIPSWHHLPILKRAKEVGVCITPEDLIYGRKYEDEEKSK